MCNSTVSDTCIILTSKFNKPIITEALEVGEVRIGKARFTGGNENLNLTFRLAEFTEQATVKLFDLRGRLVRSFSVDVLDDASNFIAEWDGKDNKGNLLPSGTYVWQIEAKNNPTRSGVTVLTR